MLTMLPATKEEVNEVYGNPDSDGNMQMDPGFPKENLDVFDLPFAVRGCWNHSRLIERLVFHKAVGLSFMEALREILEYRGYQYLFEKNLDLIGDVWSFRRMVGGTLLSTHAWGIALDYCPDLGPYLGKDAIPSFISDAFRRQGFVQLAHDPMHFQGCTCWWRA